MRTGILLSLLLLLRSSKSFLHRGNKYHTFDKYSLKYNPIQTLENSKSKKEITMRMTKKQLDQRAMAPLYIPRTENQQKYVNYLQDPNTKLVVGVGPAGSGKTLFACNTAVEELRQGNIQKIILTRPVVPVEEEELGFLPGSLINKMDPWTRPLFDVLLDFYNQKDIDSMLHGGVLEISPLAYMRGRTFKRAFIIADEMQNSTPNQMVMLMTRLGDHSKMVITGDLYQSDRGMQNGLSDFLEKLKQENQLNQQKEENKEAKENQIKYVELGKKDIQRSPIVSRILDIYNNTSKPIIQDQPKSIIPIQIKDNNAAMIPKSIIPIQLKDNDAAMIPKSQILKSI